MDNQLLNMGAILMLVGMGAVFVFLTALVGVTALMSRLVMRYQSAKTGQAADPEEIAAISAAIARHRSDNRHGR